MNHVFVVQEKNIKNVVEPYKNTINDTITIRIKANATKTFFFDFKIWLRLLLTEFNELRSSKLFMKPLFLPILKNLFFLLLKISSVDILLKNSKLLIIDFWTFCKIKFLFWHFRLKKPFFKFSTKSYIHYRKLSEHFLFISKNS